MFNEFLSSIACEYKLLLVQLSSFNNGFQIVKFFFYYFQVVGLCRRAIISCIYMYSKMGELWHNQLSCKINEELLLLSKGYFA